ncbi:hypothetical protein [Vreelandella glaciei]|uniref:helix-turn-helix domain-containing protein n=1 Tax=Vreelandella glaciei TaxID=186761 RepID=UPI0030ECE25D
MNAKHLSPGSLNERRKQAVRLRLDGHTVLKVTQQTGLSAPTVSAAWKAFREGGWAAVPVKTRGRLKGQANVLDASFQKVLWQVLNQAPPDDAPAWSSAGLADWLKENHNLELTQRAIEHWWESEGLKHEPWPLVRFAKQRSQQGRWYRQSVEPLFSKTKEATQRWQVGVRRIAHPSRSVYQFYLHGVRGRLLMRCFERPPVAADYVSLFKALSRQGPGVVVFHGALLEVSPEVKQWLAEQPAFWLVPVPRNLAITA